MPQNTTLPVTDNWTLITDSDVTAATFVNVNGYTIYVQGTAGASAPPAGGGIPYGAGMGEANVSLADLFPGVSGVNRLWARVAFVTQGLVFVSHA